MARTARHVHMWKFLRNSMLFIALAVGSVIGVLEGHDVLVWHTPSWVVPALLFCMLFLAFCKINPKELRLKKWHLVLLVYQLAGCLLLFFAVRPFSLMLAQGLMICVLMPTATAAPIITDRLGGNITQITAYVLLSNIITAVFVPLFFPFVNPAVEVAYFERFLQILRHVAPLLFVPFFGAWAVRLCYDTVQRKHGSQKRFRLPDWLASMPFYLWVLLIVILIARTVRDLCHYEGELLPVVGLFVGTMIICLGQFLLGRSIGSRCDFQGSAVTVGQSLGQKNSALAIWMTQSWLNPLAALAPAAYIIWQNLFNSWQLYHSAKLPSKP